MFPASGSFISNDPITVLFSAEEFELPGDGSIEVKLDGATKCRSDSQALFHCDLSNVEAGSHTVAVSLLHKPTARDVGKEPDDDASQAADSAASIPDQVTAAFHAVTFTVRRPQVELVYPSHGAHVLLQPSLRLPRGIPRESVVWAQRAERPGEDAPKEPEEAAAVSLQLTTLHIGDTDTGEPRARNALLLRIEVAPPAPSFGATRPGRFRSHVLDWYVDRSDHHVLALLLPVEALGVGAGATPAAPTVKAPLFPAALLLHQDSPHLPRGSHAWSCPGPCAMRRLARPWWMAPLASRRAMRAKCLRAPASAAALPCTSMLT